MGIRFWEAKGGESGLPSKGRPRLGRARAGGVRPLKGTALGKREKIGGVGPGWGQKSRGLSTGLVTGGIRADETGPRAQGGER